jgi:hypothetical protein
MTMLLITFSRRTDQPFERSLDALAQWRPDDARTVALGCATIDLASDTETSRYRLALRLRRFGRSVPMELRVTPWSSNSGTHIELLPLRAVRPNGRYFRRGRAVLNDVVHTVATAPRNAGDPRYSTPTMGLRDSA